MSHADWLRNLANSHKDTLTVADYERLFQIALALEAGDIDKAIVEAVIESRGVELTFHDDPYGSFGSWTARKDKRVGYSQDFNDTNDTNLARAALVGFARRAPDAGERPR